MEGNELDCEMENLGTDRCELIEGKQEDKIRINAPLCSRQKLFIIFSFVLVITLICLCAILLFPMFYTRVSENDKLFFYYDYNIKNTTELQIDIYNSSLWSNREEQINIWINIINTKSKFINTTLAQVKESVRLQHLIVATNCTSRDEFRVRNILDGDGAGDSYIDIKSNSHKELTACTAPITPSIIYLSNSSQKCERDLHECQKSDKFGRESRIFFSNGFFPKLHTCQDLLELYPDAFPSIKRENYNMEVRAKSWSNWWVRKYSGVLAGDTKYEITFTLYYPTENTAIEGNSEPFTGEWSIRVYSLGDGFIDLWNTEVVDDIAFMYSELMNEVGRPGYCD